MRSCNGIETQQWSFDRGKIKLTYKNKCLGGIQYNELAANVLLQDCGSLWSTISTRTHISWQKSTHDPGLIAIGSSIRSRYKDGMCLEADFESKGNVDMKPCHGKSSQEWYFENEQLKSKQDNKKCLGYNKKGHAYMQDCDDGDSKQKWQFHGDAMKVSAAHRGFECLDWQKSRWTSYSKVGLNRCNGRSHQQWYFGENDCAAAASALRSIGSPGASEAIEDLRKVATKRYRTGLHDSAARCVVEAQRALQTLESEEADRIAP